MISFETSTKTSDVGYTLTGIPEIDLSAIVLFFM